MDTPVQAELQWYWQQFSADIGYSTEDLSEAMNYRDRERERERERERVREFRDSVLLGLDDNDHDLSGFQ